jgi:amidohydrolase
LTPYNFIVTQQKTQPLKLSQHIRKLARDRHEHVVYLRRHLHRYPELSFKEENTARFVAQELERLGIPHQTGIAGTGVVAVIEGQQPSDRVIALRADMDALPIEEANDVPYKSAHPGIMHACGHDVHTASLLGTAAILQAIRHELPGKVKLIFQPGEESVPGGASVMIAEGILEDPAPALIFGQHVHPPLEAGKVGFCSGNYMASSDELYLTIHGKGGHGALPNECTDPIAIAAQVISALQQLVSRMNNPLTPTVLTFGKINSRGGATNIITDAVDLEGTFRTMDENWRAKALEHIEKMAKGIAEGMGGYCELKIARGYPNLYNHEALTHGAIENAAEYLGPQHVVALPQRMSSEDFAFYAQKIPACFYRLGTGNPAKGIRYPVHSNRFDIDESALETATGLMAWLAYCSLENKDL